MRDIEPRNTFADGLSGNTFSRFGRWQGARGWKYSSQRVKMAEGVQK